MGRVLALWFALVTILAGQGVFEKRVAPVAANETQAFQKQVKVALVVGISKYPEASGFSALNYAASDANDLAAVLNRQGYMVRVLTDTDAIRGSIKHTLEELGGLVDKEQGTFLFYFSGHGFTVNGKSYLAPASASATDLDKDGLAVDDVQESMAKSKARRQLMLLDACRSDDSSEKKGGEGRTFSALQSAEGLRILNSSQLGRVSYESQDLRHGVFTAFLLKGLAGEAAGSDGLVTFHDLTDYVTVSVRRWGFEHSRVQVPYEAVGQAEASGDFLLAMAAKKDSTPFNAPKPAPAFENVVSSFQGVHTLVIGLYGCNQQPGVIVCRMKVTRSGNFNGILNMAAGWETELIDAMNVSHRQSNRYIINDKGNRLQQLHLGPGESATMIHEFAGAASPASEVRIRFGDGELRGPLR